MNYPVSAIPSYSPSYSAYNSYSHAPTNRPSFTLISTALTTLVLSFLPEVEAGPQGYMWCVRNCQGRKPSWLRVIYCGLACAGQRNAPGP